MTASNSSPSEIHSHSASVEKAIRQMQSRLDFVGIDENLRSDLRKLTPLVAKHLRGVFDRFYDKVIATPDVSRFFNGDDHVEAAKNIQMGHWETIIAAEFDEDYLKNTNQIGKVHAAIGLEPRWYIGGYALMVSDIVGQIIDELWPRQKALFSKKEEIGAREVSKLLGALIKGIFLDMDIALTVYIDTAEQEKELFLNESLEDQKNVLEVFSQALSSIAKNDLSYRINEELPQSYGQMATEFNEALGQLEQTMKRVDQASKKIENNSDEIREVASALASGSEQQAAAVEQTASAIREMTGGLEKSSKSADQVSDLVSSTRDKAEQSGQTMNEAMQAMESIKSASDEIVGIISIIDDLAFQTNLLALNAGVEAARAGEAGRGFAVVAEEVRNLAQRSAEAAKNITSLIDTSANAVRSGADKVNLTGKAMEEIISEIVQVSSHLQTMSMMAKEHATGLNEINIAVGSVDNNTQRNSALADQANLASQNLSVEVGHISELIDKFTMSDGVEAQLKMAG